MKLISLNIEGDKHQKRVIPFLTKEQADVICLQEVLEKDLIAIAKKFKMRYVFAPMTLKHGEKSGIAIMARSLVGAPRIKHYHLPSHRLKEYGGKNKRKTIRQVLLVSNVLCEGKKFPVAVTHFTWTPDGMPDDYQKKDIKTLLRILKGFPKIILCGDFNIPRNANGLYKQLTKKFTDTIPLSYQSSLDLNLHKKGKDPINGPRIGRYMVDYLFLTKAYQAKNVRLQDGVSDHKAIIGNIVALS